MYVSMFVCFICVLFVALYYRFTICCICDDFLSLYDDGVIILYNLGHVTCVMLT